MKSMCAMKAMKAISTILDEMPYFEIRCYSDGTIVQTRVEPNTIGRMTTAGAYLEVAKSIGLKPKQVKAAVEGVFRVAAAYIKKNCRAYGRAGFTVAGMLKLKLAIRDGRKARKGIHPFTKEPCVFKASSWKFAVRAVPTKRFKEMVIN